MIPGGNVLSMAMLVISPQAVQYVQSTGRALNDIGQWVTTYADPVTLYGSFQPVPRKLYEMYGLNLQKSYFTFYVSKNIIDLQRNVSADQLVVGSQKYQCESSNDWYSIDGWDAILCVLISGQAN